MSDKPVGATVDAVPMTELVGVQGRAAAPRSCVGYDKTSLPRKEVSCAHWVEQLRPNWDGTIR